MRHAAAQRRSRRIAGISRPIATGEWPDSTCRRPPPSTSGFDLIHGLVAPDENPSQHGRFRRGRCYRGVGDPFSFGGHTRASPASSPGGSRRTTRVASTIQIQPPQPTRTRGYSTRCNPVFVAGCAGVAFCCTSARPSLCSSRTTRTSRTPVKIHSDRVRARDLVDYSCRGEPSRVLQAQAGTVRPIRKGDAAGAAEWKPRGPRGRCIGPLKAKTRVRIPLEPPTTMMCVLRRPCFL